MSGTSTTFDPQVPLQERRRAKTSDEEEAGPEREFFATIIPHKEKGLFKRPKGRLGMG